MPTNKTIGYISFALMLILSIFLIIATLVEHIEGTEYAFNALYNSTIFNLILAWLSLGAVFYIFQTEMYKRPALFVLHIAMILILIGAAITRISGETGSIHLRENTTTSSFFKNEGQRMSMLPFSISLKKFSVEYYPGTSSPSNYVSLVEVVNKHNGDAFEQEISMNKILKYQGYRFFQASFDEDMQGTVLSINNDYWGTSISYFAYYLLFFSMLWLLVSKKERFFVLLKKLTTQNILPCTIALISLTLASQAFANTEYDSEKEIENLKIDKEHTAEFSKIWVNYQGRICPLQTLATDFTTKLTGKTKYKSLNAEQFLLAFVLYPQQCYRLPIFEIKHPELKTLANTHSMASCMDMFTKENVYKLESYKRAMLSGDSQSAVNKEIAKIDEKIQIILMLQNGDLLNIFMPTSTDSTAKNTDLFAQNFLAMYKKTINDGEMEDALSLISKLKLLQEKGTGNVLPSKKHQAAEIFYNKANLFSWLFKINLSIGALGLLIFLFCTIKNKPLGKMQYYFSCMLIISFLIATFAIALRTYIAGRLPMSNGYETMLSIAWCSLLIGLITRKYSFVLINFSLLLSGFTLLVAHIGAMNPQITPLVPVLQSRLLSLHVSIIMVSYGLCGFMFLNSLTSLFIVVFSKKRQQTTDSIEKMKELSELFMFPATFFLGAGIFIGAIWANISWGRYWGWDPKEVWALISFLLMGFTFHGKTLTWFQKPIFYHLFVILIFASILMTYFGVNHLLAGKHSYN